MDILQDEEIDRLLLQIQYWSVTPSYELSEDWPAEILPQIKFDVESDVKVVGTGLLQYGICVQYKFSPNNGIKRIAN